MEEVEAVIIVNKFSMLESFGASYTMSNLDDERWLNILYLNFCIHHTNNKREIDRKKERNQMEVFAQR